MWRVLRNIVPTRKRLWNKGVNCSPFCPRCVGVEETLDHLLRDCPWAKQAWFSSIMGIVWEDNPVGSFVNWFLELIETTPREVVEGVCAVAYAIWRARNRLCFDNKDSVVTDVALFAIQELHEYKCKQQQLGGHAQASASPPSSRIWCPPPSGYYKLNVDAAGADNDWGLAAVIRDDRGMVVAACCKQDKRAWSPEMAETAGLVLGVKLARDLGLWSLCAEADCQTVILKVQTRGACGAYIDLLIQELLCMVPLFSCISFSHVFREANSAAHWLAKRALVSQDEIWLGCTPPCIRSFIASNVLPRSS
ncbi:uncharacterized protein LOC130736993 [Lotus japonicus]|uniref:uncharacterized protein LOC130736993 n=1 Tax=Lotus japonicus TaxID=34305 RepID=UPI00258A5621|nr:uncharacterized protein LOC130736993 [Lotus japonicus]